MMSMPSSSSSSSSRRFHDPGSVRMILKMMNDKPPTTMMHDSEPIAWAISCCVPPPKNHPLNGPKSPVANKPIDSVPHTPQHKCTARGELLRVAFALRKRKIAEWREIPQPGEPGPARPEDAPDPAPDPVA